MGVAAKRLNVTSGPELSCNFQPPDHDKSSRRGSTAGASVEPQALDGGDSQMKLQQTLARQFGLMYKVVTAPKLDG